MARLKIRLRGKTISEIPLDEARQYLAGRKDGCDIVLQAEKGISREHFRLSANGGAWQVESLSRFGELLVGGEKSPQVVLEHGMVFTVPPYEFEFLMTTADAAAASAAPAPSVETTGEPGEVPAPVAEAVPDLVQEKTFVGVAPSVPYIKVMDSQGEVKELIRLDGGDTYLAGRESSCNIHIRDQRVSRRQFEIRKAGAQYSIIDLGSVNGTLLNGNPISSSDVTPLKSGDAISVLENYLYFELHDPNFKSRLELVNLQPVPEAANALVPLGHHEIAHQSPMYPPSAYGSAVPAPYEMHPPAPMPVSMAPLPVAEVPKFDFKKHRPRIILGVVALVALIFAFSNGKDDSAKNQSLGSMKNDPLAKLNPEQKKLVKHTLQLAKSYYMQAKYEFARSELVKLEDIIRSAGGTPPFEDSDHLMKLVNEAIHVQQLQKKQEDLERARAEQEEKIQRRVGECRKQINADTTVDQVENCLGDVIQFNPTHALFEELRAEAQRLQADKAAQEAKSAAHQAEINKLKGMYSRARAIDEKGKPLEAIAAYEHVAASNLPDPGGVRGASRSRISELHRQVNDKTATYQHDAKKLVEEGKLKEAIVTLRKAREIDPNNPYLLPQILEHKQKLQEQMMVIYQEGILEESFGNVDGEEGKATGAKQKWKQILEKDVTDGEYYKKAYLKLKKYGTAQ